MISNNIIEYSGSLFCFQHFLLEFHGTHEIDYLMANCGVFRYELGEKIIPVLLFLLTVATYPNRESQLFIEGVIEIVNPEFRLVIFNLTLHCLNSFSL